MFSFEECKIQAPTINWNIVWRRFTKWFREFEKNNSYGSPSWRSQQLKIKELVEQQLALGE